MSLRGWFGKARKTMKDVLEKIPVPGRGKGDPIEEPAADVEELAEELEAQELEPKEPEEPEEPENPTPSPILPDPGPVDTAKRFYVSISRVGSVRSRSPRPASNVAPVPGPVFEAPQPTGPHYVGTAQLGSAAVKAPAPSAVRNMHRFALTPLASKAAEFVLSENPGADSGEELDFGDDLFSFVARTINLKMRRNQVEPVEDSSDSDVPPEPEEEE